MRAIACLAPPAHRLRSRSTSARWSPSSTFGVGSLLRLAVAGAQLDSCRAGDQTQRWRTFSVAILDARRKGSASTAFESAPLPHFPLSCSPRRLTRSVLLNGRLLELFARRRARRRHERARWSRAAGGAADGRFRACFACLRSVRLSHVCRGTVKIPPYRVANYSSVLGAVHVLMSEMGGGHFSHPYAARIRIIFSQMPGSVPTLTRYRVG